jgi:tRNA 2-selenouridine synthase
MIQEIEIEAFLKTNIPLIDVRSPGEYEKAHIPGSVNIPLFSDDERAHVGTVYVQQSKEKAMELGYQYVNPKLSDFIIQSRKVAPDGKVAIHCWRGGMRSHSFAQHLNDNGFTDVAVIVGGYKAYRHHVLETFDIPFDLQIISGYTGSGKTLVIRHLQNMGLQAIDLEELARHKGSAFGAMDQFVQPTSEQFENNLFEAWRKLDYSQPIWLEDESHNIGGVNIPLNLFNQMRNSPAYFLDIPKEERARYLVAEYASIAPELLDESINKISKRLGGLNTSLAHQFLKEKKFFEVAFLALSYYDKTYLKGIQYRNQSKVYILSKSNTDPVENTHSIINFYEQHKRDKINPI